VPVVRVLAALVLAVVRVRVLAALARVEVLVRARALVAAMLVLAAPAQIPVAWVMVPADRATATAMAMVKEAAREEREEREVARTDDLELASDMTQRGCSRLPMPMFHELSRSPTRPLRQ
jgi:uncharacterized membrane protein